MVKHASRGILTVAFLVAATWAGGPASAQPANAARGETVAIDRAVVDRSRTLTASEVADLTARLQRLRARTGAQMAILLVGSTSGEPIEDFALRTAEAWRGGSAERNDGLLLTLALVDRRSRLEVGYGLEASITDGEAKAILDAMRPALRERETAKALAGAIEAIARELPAQNASLEDGGYLAGSGWPSALFAVLLALGIVVTFLVVRTRWPRTEKGSWFVLGVATVLLAALTGWLYADLGGFAWREAICLALLVGLWSVMGVLIGKSHRTKKLLPGAGPAAVGVGPVATGFVLFALAAPASEIAAFLLLFIVGIGGTVVGVVWLVWTVTTSYRASGYQAGRGGVGSGSSTDSSFTDWSSLSSLSSSSHSSSSSSTSDSSSSSSDSGGGGSFGGGGASSDW